MVQLVAGQPDEVSELPEGLRITRTSSFTRQRNTMTLKISVEQYNRWRAGGILIQDAFPDLRADEREFLMTGCTPEEWKAVFGDGEED